MGAYTAAYTAAYPSSAGMVEEGYTLPTIVLAAVVGGSAGSAGVLDGLWRDATEPDFLFSRTALSSKALTLVKQDGTWSAVTTIPATYDRLVGGGYDENVTLTELGELLSAGLITSDQYDAAIATM